MRHLENHKIMSVGFLRAAVLGANDGLISTSSLIVGVASSGLNEQQIITTSVAALIAGAMSMAAGEYVSVSSQADTEAADIEKEELELEEHPVSELKELENIYIQRGLSQELAAKVALELTDHNALEAHLRDELGITEVQMANPLQAATASAVTFAVGSILSILVVLLVDLTNLVLFEAVFSILVLLIMGGVAAKAGGANMIKGALRVAFWGAVAMGFTAVVGNLFGATIN
jgi:VIT1/CCC1 family predicted Fe2+/Mn2+ transporter